MKKTQKTKKRIIALILAILTVFSVFTMTTVSAYAKVNQESYPISEYPDKTYYTTTDKDCTSSHKSCKSYAGGKQCFAFAKYAYDQYSHRSTWSNISGDKYISGRKIDTLEHFKQWMQNDIKYGSYVRLTIKGDDTTGHSFIFLSASSTGVKMYDANYTGYCMVDTHTVNYETLFNKYKDGKILEAYCHTFSKYSKYDSTYHKAACSSSGCTGFKYVKHSLTYTSNGTSNHTISCSKCGYSKTESHVLTYTKVNSKTHTVACDNCNYSAIQSHFADSPGTNVKCAGCDYVGNISAGRMSAGDEIASVENEVAN